MADDAPWRRGLKELNDAQPESELAQRALAAIGGVPFVAPPLIWGSHKDDRTTWHALALTDYFVAKAELFLTEGTELRDTTVTLLPLARVGEIVWKTEPLDVRVHPEGPWPTFTSVILNLGDLQVGLPAEHRTNLSEDERAFVEALSRRLH